MDINLIMLTFGIIYILGLRKDSLKFKRIGYIALLAIPIGSTNKILSYLDIITIGDKGISYIHWIIITCFLVYIVCRIINKKIPAKKRYV